MVIDNPRTAYASQVGRKPTVQRNLPRLDPNACFDEEDAKELSSLLEASPPTRSASYYGSNLVQVCCR